jgi:hypothetical protein
MMSPRTLKDNWRVFPYYDGSILNLRFIDQVEKRPVIDKIIYRGNYASCGDFEAEVEELVFRLNDDGFNCYQLVNHLPENFVGQSVCDSDIETIDKIFIDVDRVRTGRTSFSEKAEEKPRPASQRELDESRRVIDSMCNWLIARSWPDPYLSLSGNGYHVYFLTNLDALESNSENTLLRRAFLQALARKFDSTHSQIDRGVYNSARVTKIIGTLARKGQCSEGRPYRTVELISAPPIIDCVVNDDLRSVIDEICPELVTDPYRKPASRQIYPSTPETPRAVFRLRHALSYISADSEYDRWLVVLWSILSTGWECAQEIAYEWSISAPHRFDEEVFLHKCHEFDPAYPGGLTVGTVFYLAKAGGWNG